MGMLLCVGDDLIGVLIGNVFGFIVSCLNMTSTSNSDSSCRACGICLSARSLFRRSETPIYGSSIDPGPCFD